MPISIPTLKKIQSSPTPAGQRVKGQVRDSAGLIENITGNVVSLANKGADLYQEIEDNKINQLSEESGQKYSEWHTKKLIELKSYKGNPTDAYAQFDKDEKEFSEKLLASRPNLNERVKRHVEASLGKTQSSHRIQVIKQRGLQENLYNTNLYESSLKLKQNDMPLAAGDIRIGDESSFHIFNQNVVDIKTLIAKKGLKEGTVEKLPGNSKTASHTWRDVDGNIHKVKMSNIAKERVAKEISDGIANSVKVLIDNGRSKEAAELMKRYGKSIEGKEHVTIEKKFKSVRVKEASFAAYKKIANKSAADKSTAINKMMKTNPEVARELDEINDAEEARRSKSRKRRIENANYRASKQVFDKMNGGNPYNGIAEYKNDPNTNQDDWETMSGKDRERIKKMIVAPKDSSNGSLVKLNNLFLGRDDNFKIETITPEEFESRYKAGLSKADRKAANSKFQTLRIETASTQRATHKRAGELLKRELLLDGHIDENKFGKLSPDDSLILMEADKKMLEFLGEERESGTFSDVDLQKFVENYSVAFIKGGDKLKRFEPIDRRPDLQKEIVLTRDERRTLKIQYSELHGGKFPESNDPEFKKFVKDQMRGK